MKMTRQEKIIWSLFAGVLILLFLLSSTDLIIKEKKTEIYPVSVIIGETTDDYYTNFRKGVDKAADEYNVDVNFITLYEKGDVTEQMELLKREIDDGAKAVVLVPLKQKECSEILDGMVLASPLIVMGTIFPGDWGMTGISQDCQEAGKMLGEAIAAENTPDKPVFLFSEGLEYGYNRDFWACSPGRGSSFIYTRWIRAASQSLMQRRMGKSSAGLWKKLYIRAGKP